MHQVHRGFGMQLLPSRDVVFGHTSILDFELNVLLAVYGLIDRCWGLASLISLLFLLALTPLVTWECMNACVEGFVHSCFLNERIYA